MKTAALTKRQAKCVLRAAAGSQAHGRRGVIHDRPADRPATGSAARCGRPAYRLAEGDRPAQAVAYQHRSTELGSHFLRQNRLVRQLPYSFGPLASAFARRQGNDLLDRPD